MNKENNWILSTEQKISKIVEDIEDAREINHEAYLDDADRYRLGKSDAYLEVLSMLRKNFNLM